jgi:hypothetical protein
MKRTKDRTMSSAQTKILAALSVVGLTALDLPAGCSKHESGTAYRVPNSLQLSVRGEVTEFANQSEDARKRRDANCVECHKNVEDPHQTRRWYIACVDCHGGNENGTTKEEAHPRPSHAGEWQTSANPEESYVLLNHENWDWVRFVNPGDLRVAKETCGPCHFDHWLQVSKSLMTNAAHFWGAAAYCNGIVSKKKTFLGESYGPRDPDGSASEPHAVFTVWGSEAEKMEDLDPENHRSIAEAILPLPHWEVTQTGNIYRVFEQGSRLGGTGLGLNGLAVPAIGLPDKLEDPGRPNNRLSDRGLGTLNRVDLPILNLQKTRLNDPHLSFLGTNDQPGDYRSSGCTACHMVYANDRNPVHSGPYAKYGNSGRSFNPDPTLQESDEKDRPGHPIDHKFTIAPPTSQCMVCHHHQPNAFLNTYLGFQMWSYETDGRLTAADGTALPEDKQPWPAEQHDPPNSKLLPCDTPSNPGFVSTMLRNPEEAVTRGNWRNPEFLRNVSDLNPFLKHTQFADYHGHGWIFRAVFKMDRYGNFLDADDKKIEYSDMDKFKGVIPRVQEMGKDGGELDPHFAGDGKPLPGKAVHLKDIHAERGMHCVDCHFTQDVHGNTKLYAEYQAAIEIQCEDCHGSAAAEANLKPTGPASPERNRNSSVQEFSTGEFTKMSRTRNKTPWGQPRFYKKDGEIKQRSMLYEDKEWTVPQVKDSKSEKARLAHFLRKGGRTADSAPSRLDELAHDTGAHGDKGGMTCYSCHTSWITSCFGCHLPQRANMRTPMRHFEEKNLRNFASYNPQVARDDAFMLGVSPDVQLNKISTVRSSSALVISSEDGLRQRIYAQIPTTAGNGMSSQAFNTHFAHAVRKSETRKCDDCHVSEENDNNAWLAQVYLLGTNFVNFFGYHAYVGCGEGGFYGVRVTEWVEPQAVIGSYLHSLAYPDLYSEFKDGGRILTDYQHHSGRNVGSLKFSRDVRSLALRGEYLFAASGKGGFWAYDVANVANKGFSEKMVTAPVSPLGQDPHVSTTYATAVALPTNNYISLGGTSRPRTRFLDAIAGLRRLGIVDEEPEKRRFDCENRETNYPYKGRDQYMHESYRYAYVTDREEGLIVIDVDCLSDGDPENNFLERKVTFNPEGKLSGAENLTVAGTTVYVCARDGVYAVDIDDPLDPKVIAHVGEPAVKAPVSITVQFRYAFLCDAEGVKVLDVTVPAQMEAVPGAVVPLGEAHDIYVARTYGYVAAGSQGLVILDLEQPKLPAREIQIWNADGQLNDLRQVKVGMTNDTVFAYMADGRNGFRIAQLISPEDAERTQRSAYGFSPKPAPKLIATFPTNEPALAVSKGLDRDRAVDESGNQMAVFGRIGGRPLNLKQREKLYLRDGKLYTVTKEPKKSGESR